MNSTDLGNVQNVKNCFEFIETSCPKTIRSTAINAVLYVFIIISILITIWGNLVIVISISHFRQLQTPTNYLAISLSVADFLLGLMILPYSMIRSVETCWYFGDIFCKLHSSLDLTLTTASIFSLCFIAIDRYYAVCDPLVYPTKITLPVIGMFLTFTWVFSIVYGFGLVYSDFIIDGMEDYIASISCQGSCVLIFNKLWGHLDTVIAFFIPSFIIAGAYLKIFFVARKHAKVIGKKTNKIYSTDETSITISYNKEHRAAKKN